jgi:hypothetical protein
MPTPAANGQLAQPDDDQANAADQTDQPDPVNAETAGTLSTADPSDQAMAGAFERYTQQQLQKQNSALQAHIAAAAEKDPDITAEAQRLGLQVGVGADVASRNMDQVRKMALVNDAGAQNLPQTAPKLAKLLEDPDFSGVAYDDVENLSRVEQGAAAMRAQTENSSRLAGLTPTQRQAVIADRVRVATSPGGFLAEAEQAAASSNAAFFGAAKPFIDAVGGTVEAALDAQQGDAVGMMRPANEFAVPRATAAIQSWLSRPITQHGPQQTLIDPATQQPFRNPDYKWYGRPLANAIEQVPGTLEAFGMGGGAAGAGAEAAGAGAEAAEVVGTKSVASVLGTQAAQNTYAEARAKGADQKKAVLAALASGAFNYATMGEMPGAPPAESVAGAVGQWATRSATMGAGMTVGDNAIARSYDPNRSLTEGLPQSIATMAAFEGVGAMGHIVDAVGASKLRTRSPEAFQQFAAAAFDGDPSVRIPAQEFVDYFHKQNIDPAAMANHLGASNLEEAAAAGSDLEVPKENFFGKLDPEHQKGLLPDVIDPATDMTSRQAEAGHAELQDWISNGGAEKLQAEFQQADAETQASPEWQSVKSDLKQRYVDAGETEPVAENYATLQANAISYFARNTGLKPDEVLALHNPQIVTGGAAPDEVLHQGSVPGDEEPGEGEEAASPSGPEELLKANLEAARTQRVKAIQQAEDGLKLRIKELRARRAKILQDGGDASAVAKEQEELEEQLWKSESSRNARETEELRGRLQRELDEGRLAYVDLTRDEARFLYPERYEWLDEQEKVRDTPHLDALRRTSAAGEESGAAEPSRNFVEYARDAEGVDYDATAKSLPEVPEGYVRLFRSESPTVKFGDVFDKNKLGAFANRPEGESYTDDLSYADYYRQSYGKDARTSYVDVPEATARLAKVADGEYVLNRAGEVLHQASPEAESANSQRGWFRILGHGRYEIGKTKLGDLSTFVHEPAHAYLEYFRELTQREGASEQLQSDFKKIADWLGTTPEELHKNGFTTEQQEQWAEGTEQYTREGKAPNAGLTRVFQQFGVWLQTIYRRASALGVDMSDDIRGVMDRLYAGENAVDRASQEAGEQRTFEKPEDAGWTEAEFRNYADAKGVEVSAAKEQVVRELSEAAEREHTQDRREEARNVRDAVTEQIDARPEYTAIRSLRRGKLEDETPLTMNREALVNQFGEGRVKALQKLHPGLYRSEGGTDAETAAEIFGFHSGDDMMRSLEAAPRRSQAIEAATRDYLVNKYGDVRYDGSLNDRARFALENNERAGNIYRELRALRAKAAGLEKKAADAKAAMAAITIEPLEHYQEAARHMVDQKAIADLQPHRYLDASRKFSREAFDALRAGNVRRAAEAKNKELLNHFLFREASAARDYATKFEKYVQRVQSRGIQQRLGLAGSDYREQFNWLLSRYRLGPQTAAPERSLRDWAEEMYGNGNEPAIAPGILNEGRNADYRGVPMSELHDVHDALVNIRHLAQQEFKMFVQGKQVAFGEARAAMVQAARENLRVKPERIFEENRTAAEKITGGLQYVDARLMRMERLFEWLDGGKAGPWHDNLWNLASDAQGDEYGLQHGVTKAVTDALADMPDEMRRRLWTEKANVDGVSEPLSRHRMLSMAFNMGNEGNLDRLRKTFIHNGWDPEAIRRIGGMLTHGEWQFVQKAWDSLKPLGERMGEMEKRLTGLPPTMVKVTPFKVALDDGTEMDLAGGYFPIVMDPRFSERAITQEAKETAQNAMQSGYVRATTSRGYTKERTGFGGPLLLDYERAMTSHVAKVAKDLSHREFMLSSQRLLLDTEMRKTLRETLGQHYEEQFMPWLRTIINDNNGSVQEGLDGLKDGMQKLRGNFVAASLGFNSSTVLLQISHAPRMLLYARPGSLAQALGDLLARPIEATREIRALSPNEMRFRGDNLDRDVRAVLQKPSYQNGYTKKVAVAARFALATMDHLFSHTLWRAAYNDAQGKYVDLPEEEAQKKAVHEADSAVRLGLGTSAPKDLPAIMRSNEFNKFITTLYGFHNGVYGQLRDIGHQFRYDRSVAKLTGATILTAVLPALLGSLLTGRGPKQGENPGWWAGKRSLLFSADTVPVLRSAASFMDGGHDVQFSPLETLMQKGAKDAMEASSDKEDKDWMGIGIDAGEVAGEAGGVLGAHQGAKILRYIHRADQGKIENPNAWDAVVGGGRR